MPPADPRPDPDLLLRRVQAEEARAARAQLKIFFGFAPGVGKTYAMLESARRLKEDGVDIVVGAVETHGREETAALLDGAELLPPRAVEYRGALLSEFDLEAALQRHPEVLLLDELAHSNAPGSRHAKRWQDVLDLLDAGIDVHTTLNVQHVESLNDVVSQVTSIRVRETVPDAVLDRADEIELIDLPADELIERLHEGKVYLGEAAGRAAQNFFQRGNLLALRELALRRAAERVDQDVRAYREAHAIDTPWAARERLLVCVQRAPTSTRLIRATRRMADGLRAPWVVAFVESPVGKQMGAEERADLEADLRLAESLGGEVVRLTGTRIADAVLDYARTHHVTRIVVGKPTHSRWLDLIRGSVLADLVRASDEIDIQVIAGDEVDDAKPEQRSVALPTAIVWRDFAIAGALVALATAVSGAARGVLDQPDVVMIFLLVIVLVAVRSGRGPSIFAAAVSVAAYDFYFVPPYFTFAVSDVRHLLSFAMMFAVGILISGLTLRIRRHELEARAREERTARLFAFTRDLGSAVDELSAASVTAKHVADVFVARVAVLVPTQPPRLEIAAQVGAPDLGPAEIGVARWCFEHGRTAGLGTDTLPGARAICVPVRVGDRVLGVIALVPLAPIAASVEQRHFLEVFVHQAALAIARARLAEEAKAAALRARAEEMRSSLLSAVSHDLRTPLAAITGAATALRQDGRPTTGGDHGEIPPTVSLSATTRHELLDSICEEASRLERLVANLLEMTRLDAGGVEVKREWVPLEEIIGGALARLRRALQSHPVEVRLAPTLPLVAVDAVLYEQVFLNLLENAAKHTPAGVPIDVHAAASGGEVEVVVADRGPGFAPAEEAQLFSKFFRGSRTAQRGAGLGLAIVRGIVEAHGGRITALNRVGGGAEFRFTIPIVGTPPAVPVEESELHGENTL